MWNKEAPAAGAGGALCSLPGPSALGWHTLTCLDGTPQHRNRDSEEVIFNLFINLYLKTGNYRFKAVTNFYYRVVYNKKEYISAKYLYSHFFPNISKRTCLIQMKI